MNKKTYQFKKKVPIEETKNCKFKGFDYAELYECFGLSGSAQNPKELQEYLFDVLMEISENSNSNVKREKRDPRISACRKFVKALSIANPYTSPLWRGLSEIKNTEIFLDLFIKLLPHAWS